MAQSITIAGATFQDVPAIEVPKSTSGTATFTDVTDTTAAAADVASGKYFYTAAGVKTQGTASGGGGGASNVVTGTFKGTTSGAAIDVTIPYTGSGWPVAVMIYPSEGPYNNQTGNFYSLVQRYAIQYASLIKSRIDDPPTYVTANGQPENACQGIARYKSSATSANSYTGSAFTNSVMVYTGADAEGTANSAVIRFKSNKKMSVYIASTSYGFAANIEYTYYIIYSS